MIRCVDLFAGCGGMSLGFQEAGLDVIAAFDNWAPSLEVYKKNFTHPVFMQDLSDVATSTEKIKQFSPDLIMGGPPCQDFSSAGNQDISKGRADLTYKFSSIVCEVKPNWFVMENVERIKNSHILADIVQEFIQNGYGLSSVILDASYCGVPQARTRFFLIGHNSDKHNQLNQILKNRLSSRPMTLRDYLGDTLGLEFYYRHPRSYKRRAVFSIDEPSATIRGVNRPVPKGYKLHAGDPSGLDLESIRHLTTIERSYVQTFPVDFLFEGTTTNLEQMIGNAVPVNLARYIADSIKQYLKHGPEKPPTLFDSLALDSIEEGFQLAQTPLHRTQ